MSIHRVTRNVDSDNSLDVASIEQRKLRMREIRMDWERTHGVHSKVIPSEVLDQAITQVPFPQNKPSRREQELLTAISNRGHVPGDELCPGDFADELGMNNRNVWEVANRMQSRGLWPYKSFRRANTHRTKKES